MKRLILRIRGWSLDEALLALGGSRHNRLIWTLVVLLAARLCRNQIMFPFRIYLSNQANQLGET